MPANGWHEDFEDEAFPPETFEDFYDERYEMMNGEQHAVRNSDITREDEVALFGGDDYETLTEEDIERMNEECEDERRMLDEMGW